MLRVCNRIINEHRWHMYYYILLFTNMFRSLVQLSSGYQTTIGIVIYFKCANIECCKTVLLVHWRLHTAEMLQLELTNGPFVIQGTTLTVIPLGCSFHIMSSHSSTLQTDTLESHLFSTCMLWSDRQLAATSSVTKQTHNTVGNSTDCNVKQTAGKWKLLYTDRLFSVITANWHTYQ